MDLVKLISSELALKESQVHNTVELLKEDCTVPFIARYRKERTGSLDEVQIRSVRDRFIYLSELEAAKEKYLKVVQEHCKKRPELAGQFPSLQQKFLACQTKQELEDLYLPFKPKRRTRAQIAREQELEPLVDKILEGCKTLTDLSEAARPFVKLGEHVPPEKEVRDEEAALQGASDILAERYAETADVRALVRRLSNESGTLKVERVPEEKLTEKAKKQATKYQNYFEYAEPIHQAPAHRVMAVRRGEGEKILRVQVAVDDEKILSELTKKIIDPQGPNEVVGKWLNDVCADAYKRLVAPSIETELRLELKQRAEEEAIRVFAKNLESLLLLPPLPDTIVMGVDPGLRTGSKLAVVSSTGKMIVHETIYPQYDKAESPKTKNAQERIAAIVKEHKVEYIAVGNGTGGREINRFIGEVCKEQELSPKRLFVNEAGASVYSTDAIAREEFPDLDPTIRSAISIARRLQDPLAELVKIDPRSIGVGQYQHDVNVTKLKSSLEDVVESCVNRVGVSLNTASYKLLSYVSGVGPTLAKNIVSHRDAKGPFDSRDALHAVSGLGPKVFTQAAGFLRVADSSNILDNSAVHPESYPIVEKIAKDRQMSLGDLIGKRDLVETLPLEDYVNDDIGMPTLKDIAAELIKPGRDPRDLGKRAEFSEGVNEIEDLKIDMELQGTVTNVTNFGAFVDIGIHQDGLVHISELSNDFVKDPSLVVSVGDILNVRVIEVDTNRRRISLSCKSKQAPQQGGKGKRSHDGQRERGGPRQGGNRRPGGKSRQNKRDSAPKKNYTLEDLMSKFNKKDIR